jgi:hypothetical protein
MEKNQNSILLKKVLLGMLLLVLIVPPVQHKFKIFKVIPLEGAVETVERPVLTLNAWLDGTFQDKRTDYLNQNVGFRNSMVRTYNQMSFSFYGIARANGVVVGRDNYLYEQNYINAYNGDDFQGEKAIHDQIEKLERVSDTLRKLGKHVVVLLAPGKASFFPEYLPKKNVKGRKTKKLPNPNLQAYAQNLAKSTIPYLNLNKYFIAQKGKMLHPLFPKTGIHWSKYGEIVMADTLIRFMNAFSNINIPRVVVDSYNVTDDAWDTDDDIERGMNLLFNIPDNVMGYPAFRVVKEPNQQYSKVLTIADSYFWGPFNWGMSRDVFGGGQFWYYNEAIYPDSFEKPLFVKDIDIKSKIEEHDAILILVTDANLFKFGFGFVEQAYGAYFKP